MLWRGQAAFTSEPQFQMLKVYRTESSSWSPIYFIFFYKVDGTDKLQCKVAMILLNQFIGSEYKLLHTH